MSQNCPKPWEPARPLDGSLGPSGPEMPKKSRKCLSEPLAQDPEKVFKKSGGQSKNTLQTLSETLRRLPRLSPRLFGHFKFWGPMAGDRGRHFRDFFGILGPEGRRSSKTKTLQMVTLQVQKLVGFLRWELSAQRGSKNMVGSLSVT